MSTRPTSDPLWATGGAANVQEPASQRTLGYPDGFPPPAGAHNWQFETLGEWIDHLRRGSPAASVAEGVANTDAGESFIAPPSGDAGEVLEADLRVGGGSLGDVSVEATGLALDATHFYMGRGAALTAWAVADAVSMVDANAAWSVSLAAYGTTIVAVDSNGTYVGVAMNAGEWVILDASDGSVLWNGDHTAALYSVALSSQYMVMCGVADASDNAVKIVTLATGSAGTSVSWGVSLNVYDVCWVTNSVYAIVAEADGSGNYVGLYSVGGSNVWKKIPTNTHGVGSVICSNGEQIFTQNGESGSGLTSFSPYDGAEIWTTTLSPVAPGPGICCDVKYLYLRLDQDDDINAYTLDGRLMKTITPAGVTGVTGANAKIVANSDMVITAFNDGSFNAGVEVYASGVGCRRWYRGARAPHFNQATPEVL